MAKLDVTDLFPWNKMEKRTVNGISMVFCPNIYVKTEVIPAGSDYAGKMAYMISEKPQDGFHIHPAFVKNGEVAGEGILWGTDILDLNAVSYNDLVTKAASHGSGFEPYNIYDHHMIARLMLIEAGSADIQTILGGADGKMGYTWHGINNVWGGTSTGFWFYGLTTEGGTIHILSNKMDGTMIDTGISCSGKSGWIKECMTDKGANYDLSDVFLAKSVDGTEANGTFGDYSNLGNGGYAFYSYYSSSSTGFGPMYLSHHSLTYKSSWLGLRLRKVAA